VGLFGREKKPQESGAESSHAEVRGQVTKTPDGALSIIVLFDSHDGVIGGGFAFLSADLPSGRRAAFESLTGPQATPYKKIHQAAVSVENAVARRASAPCWRWSASS